MNYGQLVTNVKTRCAILNESAFDADILLYLNDAQREITSRYFWNFLEAIEVVTTTAGVSVYPITNQATIINVRDLTNFITLKSVGFLDFDRYYPNPTAQGTSRLYRVIGQSKPSANTPGLQQLTLYPIPGGTYTLNVREYVDLPDMVNSSDVSGIPPRYHLTLVHYAAQAFFSSRGDQRANEHETLFENGLASMAEQLDATPIDQLEVLRSEDEQYDPRILQYPPSYGSIG